MTEQNRRVMDDVGRFIRDIGFPVFVALYFLIALGPKVDRNTDLLQRVAVLLEVKK